MKVLLDACVWGGALAQLRAAGHDSVWAGDWPENPSDEEILARAHAEARTVITLDKDFGELAVMRGAAHSGIVRLVNVSARRQGEVCLSIVERYGAELSSGALVTVSPGRVRIRPTGDEGDAPMTFVAPG